MTYNHYQKDIINLVPSFGKVLDLGCGSGELLSFLKKEKNIQGVGLDISEKKVIASLSKGVSTIQADINSGLSFYPDQFFDIVILNQTLQVVQNSLSVLKETVRIGKKTIIVMANFGHFSLRQQIFFKGRMPKNKILGHEWYNTPNIRLTSLHDMEDIFKNHNISVLKKIIYGKNGKKIPFHFLSNLLAEQFLFMIQEKSPS